MKFGPIPVEDAVGAITVHAIRAGDVALRKGTVVGETEAARLASAGLTTLVAARLEADDVAEDAAAGLLARAVAGEGLRADPPFTGRANLFAERAGLLVVNEHTVNGLNEIDEAVTLATLPAYKPVVAGEMVATIKIIPYAAPRDALERALATIPPGGALRVAQWRRRRIAALSTLLPSLKGTTVDKTLRTLGDRLKPASAEIVQDIRVPHEAEALAGALGRAAGEADLIVVFGASAIADRRDVIPAALEATGGRIEHFGMPVDPGNLLLIGELDGTPVIGAPGCARSPKENGFDWVLQRLLAGLPVTRADIVRLGVGGLLMEIVSRPQPRSGETSSTDED